MSRRRRRIVILLAVCLVALAWVIWTNRFTVKDAVSDLTWNVRSPHAGEGERSVGDGAHEEWYEIDSTAVGRRLGQVAIVPSGGGEGRGLLIFLHGRGAHPGVFVKQFAAAQRSLGRDAPVVVQVSGGDHSYYHDRDDGDWGRYVVDEAIPEAIRRFDVDPDRVSIGGYSMGGFGALDIARANPDRFCSASGHSAALWQSAGETAPGAFDDAEDFGRHDIIGEVRDGRGFGDMPVWLDAGDQDPFLPGNHALRDALDGAGTDVTWHEWPGGHSRSYWKQHIDEYVDFHADALRDC